MNLFQKILIFFLLGFIQIGIISSWKPPFNQTNIIFSFLVVLLVIDYPLLKIILWGISWSVFISLFSLYPFLYSFAFLGGLGITLFLFKNFITNYSSYSLMLLSSSSILFYQIILWSEKYFFLFFRLQMPFPWIILGKNIFWGGIFTTLGSLLIFYSFFYRRRYAR